MEISNRKIIQKAFIHSLIFSIIIWILDSIIDYLFFYNGTFIDLLILEVPPHEVYIRVFIILAIFIFALINSANLIRIKNSNQQLQENFNELDAIHQQLLANEQQLKASNQQLQASENELEKKAYHLGERMKELRGLYQINESIWRNKNLEDVMQDAVNIIPSSWQYPEITSSRIVFNNQEFLSKQFSEGQWVQSSPIVADNKIVGKIEVFYSKEMPILDEDPFLKEERELLENIAKNLSRAIERSIYHQQLDIERSQLKLQEKQFKAIFNGIDDIVYVSDPDSYEIVHANDVALSLYGDDVIGKKCYEVFHGKSNACHFCTNNEIFGENIGKTYIWETKNESNNKWFRCADKAIHWPDGRTLRFELATDITEIVNLNTELSDNNKRLSANEQQLRASEQQLKAINEELIKKEKIQEDLKLRMQLANDSAGIGVWDLDLVSNKLIWDDWMYKLYGIDPKDFGGAFEAWQKGVHPDDLGKANKEVELAIRGEKEFDSEFRIITPNGEVRYLKAFATVIKDETGKPIKMIGVNYDISLHKESERNLEIEKAKAEENEIRFKALHNASFGGITIHDKGLILDCNKGLSEITGYSLDELIGMDGLLLIAEESRDMVMSNILAKYEKPYEAIGIRKNGEKYPLRLEARMIPYKGQEVRVVEFRDISEERKHQLALKEVNSRYQTIIRNFPNGAVFLFDKAFKYIHVEGKALKQAGLVAENLIGKTYLDVFPPQATDIITPNIKNIFLGMPCYYEVEFAGNIYANWGEPIYNDKNKIHEGVVFTLDITNLKETELKLIKARKKAEESDQLKSAFLANMSHEIRTPMNGILGFTSLLEEPDLTSEEKSQYIEIIKRSGLRMLNTVNDIIDISKIDAGQMELVNTNVDICLELESIYQFFKLEARNKGIKLDYRKENVSDDFILKTDKTKFESIITNLVKNAIKFTEKGSIDIVASIENDQFTCKVKDTGIGIPKNRLVAIFNRFEQADIKDSRANEGSGLGLAISKSYAEMMGGDLTVESIVDQGSEFTLKLPV
jgi:PAS domain S-box-containing protein